MSVRVDLRTAYAVLESAHSPRAQIGHPMFRKGLLQLWHPPHNKEVVIRVDLEHSP
jgi:hypothetical protein